MFAQLADHVADKRDTVNNNNTTLPCPIPKRDFRVRFLARSYIVLLFLYAYIYLPNIISHIVSYTSHIPVNAVFVIYYLHVWLYMYI